MANFSVNEPIRTTRKWSRDNNLALATGRFLRYEGEKVLIRMEGPNGGFWRLNPEDIEAWPEHSMHDMVWIGELSGWYVTQKKAPFEPGLAPVLMHRCGFEHWLKNNMNFVANIIVDVVFKHTCGEGD